MDTTPWGGERGQSAQVLASSSRCPVPGLHLRKISDFSGSSPKSWNIVGFLPGFFQAPEHSRGYQTFPKTWSNFSSHHTSRTCAISSGLRTPFAKSRGKKTTDGNPTALLRPLTQPLTQRNHPNPDFTTLGMTRLSSAPRPQSLVTLRSGICRKLTTQDAKTIVTYMQMIKPSKAWTWRVATMVRGTDGQRPSKPRHVAKPKLSSLVRGGARLLVFF